LRGQRGGLAGDHDLSKWLVVYEGSVGGDGII
jgi:hypothetical protein